MIAVPELEPAPSSTFTKKAQLSQLNWDKAILKPVLRNWATVVKENFKTLFRCHLGWCRVNCLGLVSGEFIGVIGKKA